MADGAGRHPLVLASASPRRRELLALLDVDFTVAGPTVDESPLDGEEPTQLVVRLARAKASSAHRPGQVTVGADTVVVLDGQVVGKPADALDALSTLRSLAGRRHDVVTGVAVLGPDESADVFVERTAVWMRPAAEEELQNYVASGEPLDKAGGYGIQGRGGRFVTRIEGSYHNVVGLPLSPLAVRLHVRLGAV